MIYNRPFSQSIFPTAAAPLLKEEWNIPSLWFCHRWRETFAVVPTLEADFRQESKE